jgi:hypothetical protein
MFLLIFIVHKHTLELLLLGTSNSHRIVNPFPLDQLIENASLHILSCVCLLEIGFAFDMSIIRHQYFVFVFLLGLLILIIEVLERMGYVYYLLRGVGLEFKLIIWLNFRITS